MSTLKTQRGSVRALFTKAVNEFKAESKNVDSAPGSLKIIFTRIERHHRKILQLNTEIEDELKADKGSSEGDFTSEYESVALYDDTFQEMILVMDETFPTIDPVPNDAADHLSGSSNKKSYRLPKLEFKKFDGDPREWLGFWNQFQSIHDDESLTEEVKFQYLVQATVDKSKAREVVESFPATKENYVKVVTYLEQRFGSKDMLVEIYVRDLLKLVLSNLSGKETSVAAIYDKLETQLRALESLSVTSDRYAAMLYPLVESSLPQEVLRAWERSRGQLVKVSSNKLMVLMEFLRSEVESETRIELAQAGFCEKKQTEKKVNWKKSVTAPVTAADLFNGGDSSDSRVCIFCKQSNHASLDCYSAFKISLEERGNHIKKANVCFCCLKPGHRAKKCRGKCSICDKKHATFLCRKHPKNKPEVGEKEENSSVTSDLSNYSSGGVILQTIMVKIRNGSEVRNARALLDSGSQQSYVSEKAVAVLGLKKVGEINMRHCLFGGSTTQEITHSKYVIELEDMSGRFKCSLEALNQARICGKIERVPEGPWLREFNEAGIVVTDVGIDTPDINILLGADVIGKLLTGRIHRSKRGPVAVETNLGWTVMGKCLGLKSENDSTFTAIQLHVSNVDIQELWRLDVIGIQDPTCEKRGEELREATLKHFKETVTINNEGRYEVSLPWIEGHPPVSNNRVVAEKRLRGATKKLVKLGYKEAYGKIFEEWEQLGVIERATEQCDENGSYLPHHPVIKLSSATTPVRPVFDASAGNPSLNNCLDPGPNLIEKIPELIIWFRMNRIGVIADVKKAFLQISIRKEDQKYLLFLWWEPDGKFRVYRHRRVVFGLKPSPFLLAAVLYHHMDKEGCSSDWWLHELQRCFYVDNAITSVNSSEELFEFKERSSELLARGKFDLCGWTWNGGCPFEMEKTDTREVVPVLGLLWDTTQDQIMLDIKEPELDCGPVTKRRILSFANQVFDPMGFSAPVTLVPKLLLQEIWKSKIGWDQEVESAIAAKFISWNSELKYLKKMRIPRWCCSNCGEPTEISLHAFSDASQSAYAACIFIRVQSAEQVGVQLVMAKSRVATLKKTTIPRLELLGCAIVARLCTEVKKSLRMENVKCFYWTDSSNALYWIKKHENWGQFVWNRVEEIRKLTNPDDWRHVDGIHNPADLPSRGCSPVKFIESAWWEGPTWLRLPEGDWPISRVRYDMESIMTEKRKAVVSNLATVREVPWYAQKFSSYLKIVRLIGWILRLAKKARRESVCGELTRDEIDAAEKRLWTLIQAESFSSPAPVMKQMRVVRDVEGLLRVQSKIILREDSKDFKYPVLLPDNHPVVKLLVRHEHRKNKHCGIQILINILREKVWIIHSRKLVRETIHACVICRRYSAKPLSAIEAPLPVDRVRDAKVFEIIGVDLGGPLHLKTGEKVWFAVYTCAVYRALHLELLTSLSSECFLQSLRRFISRRGRPHTIISDNGTNFEGLSNAMKKVDWKKIEEVATAQQITWKFNAPSAPWWGGFFERMVGLVKSQLRRILGRASLTFEELQTVLCDVEGIINQRPITYLSDEDGVSALSPAAFLCDLTEYGVPDLDEIEAEGLNKRYRYRQTLKEDLRKRFRVEYLGALVHRMKQKKMDRLSLGEVVLVASDDKKRVDWPTAKIVELIPGKDGVVRTVRLKTRCGEIVRPIQRICKLELSVSAPGSESEIVTTRLGRVSKKPDRFNLN